VRGDLDAVLMVDSGSVGLMLVMVLGLLRSGRCGDLDGAIWAVCDLGVVG
jgi:hypothetical protein